MTPQSIAGGSATKATISEPVTHFAPLVTAETKTKKQRPTMKSYRIRITAASVAGALCLLPVTGLNAKEHRGEKPASSSAKDFKHHGPSAMSGMHHNKIRVATDDASDHNLHRYAGQEVNGLGGERLGSIQDFLVEAKSGKIAYAVISSGGLLGVADKLRAVPVSALTGRGKKEGEFTLNVTEAQWKQLPVLNETHFEAGNVVINPDEQKRIRDAFSDVEMEKDFAMADLIRASDIRGKDVRSANVEAGEIEEVVVNLERRMVTALFDPDDDFVDSDQRYLVPLDRFSFKYGNEDLATTTLTREDFTNVWKANRHETSAIDGKPWTDRPGYEANKEVLSSAAKSVRQAIGSEPSLKNADVEVVSYQDRLLLRGSVKNEQMKERIEDAAERGAPGIEIENQLVVARK